MIQDGLWKKKLKREVHRFDLKKSVLMKPAIRRLPQEKKFLEVLRYLYRVGEYKTYANKMVINNVYTYMRMNTPDFTRARSIFDRKKIYHQMLRQEKKLQPNYDGDCYIETAKGIFSLP
mgnify:CR=1 FL=1